MGSDSEQQDQQDEPSLRWYNVMIEIGAPLPRNEAISAALEALREAGFGAEVDADEFDLLCARCGKPIAGAEDLVEAENGYAHRECPEQTEERDPLL